MSDMILDAYDKFGDISPSSIEDIIKIDEEVRKYVLSVQKNYT
jgi:hypothetical protein